MCQELIYLLQDSVVSSIVKGSVIDGGDGNKNFSLSKQNSFKRFYEQKEITFEFRFERSKNVSDVNLEAGDRE